VRVLNFEAQGNRWQSAYLDYTLPGLELALGANSALAYRSYTNGDMSLPPLVTPTAFAQILSAALSAAAFHDRRVDLMKLWPFGEPLVRRLESAGFTAWVSAEAFLDAAGCHLGLPTQDAWGSVR
jgi:membrane associated rhomboid family serine protease